MWLRRRQLVQSDTSISSFPLGWYWYRYGKRCLTHGRRGKCMELLVVH